MKTRLYLCVGVLWLVCPMAQAQDVCPTASDLQTGIRLTQIDPVVSAVIRRSNGVFRETRVDLSSDTQRIREMSRAHFLLLPDEMGSESQTYSYTASPEDLNALPEITRWTSAVIWASNELPDREMTYEVEFQGQEIFDLGGCEYDVWVVSTTLSDASASFEFTIFYAPEVEILLGFETGDRSVRYDAITLE